MAAPKLNSLTNADRAAIVLLALGQEVAASLLAGLDPDEVRRLATAMSRLGAVDSQVMAEVLQDFESRLAHTAKGAGTRGGVDAARRLLAKRLAPEELAALGGGGDAAATMLSDVLAQADPQPLARLLSAEAPQTIAVVLAHQSPRAAAQLLARLGSEQRLDSLLRLAQLGPVDSEALGELATSLRHGLSTLADRSGPRRGGPSAVAAILGQLPSDDSSRLLDALSDRRPPVAEAVREQLLRFADLEALDERSMTELLRHIPEGVLKAALRQASEGLMAAVCRSLSPRAAAMLREDLALTPPMRLTDVQAAQRQITTKARELAAGGKIRLPGAAGEVFV